MSRTVSSRKSSTRRAGRAKVPADRTAEDDAATHQRKPAKTTEPVRKKGAPGTSAPRAKKPAPKSQRAAPRRGRESRLAVWRARFDRLRRIPGFVYLAAGVTALLVLAPIVNWIYQAARKPSELLYPVSDEWFKTPAETWRTYGDLFLANSTAIMTPELLAALAQQEASGNPVARTYWRWSATFRPFEIYRPASSAVGMYQITDGTFDEARHYCIHDHRVVGEGRWYEFGTCWFNGLYNRVLPSHAVELVSSNLDRRVRETLARNGIRQATPRQQQELAVITHLCGAGAAAAYVSRGLALVPGQHCGDHDTREYVQRVMGLVRTFATLNRSASS